MNASEQTSSILYGQLNALSRPPTDAQLRSLALVVSPTTLLAALDLIDNDQVARITLPNSLSLYQVASTSTSGSAHTVHPNIRGGYCPCPAFSQLVLCDESHIVCKHLLAVLIAEQLGGCVEKDMGLAWIEGFCTTFSSVVAVGGGPGES